LSFFLIFFFLVVIVIVVVIILSQYLFLDLLPVLLVLVIGWLE